MGRGQKVQNRARAIERELWLLKTKLRPKSSKQNLDHAKGVAVGSPWWCWPALRGETVPSLYSVIAASTCGRHVVFGKPRWHTRSATEKHCTKTSSRILKRRQSELERHRLHLPHLQVLGRPCASSSECDVGNFASCLGRMRLPNSMGRPRASSSECVVASFAPCPGRMCLPDTIGGAHLFHGRSSEKALRAV